MLVLRGDQTSRPVGAAWCHHSAIHTLAAGGVPEVPREVLVAGRQAAQGRAAGGPAGHGQDAAGARRGGRGARALLPRGRARVRRDPGRPGRAPRPGPLQ